jgi:hypothetical protein
LTEAAVRRLTGLVAPRDATIPVSIDSWRASVEDTDLATGGEDFCRLAAEVLSDRSADDAAYLRRTAEGMADAAAAAAQSLRNVAVLKPVDTSKALAVHAAITATATAVLEGVRQGHVVDVSERARLLRSRIGSVLESDGPFAEDVCCEAFGVPLSDVRDATGTFSPPRLLSHYYGNYGELDARLRAVLSSVTDDVPDMLNALHPAEALIITPRPLLTVQASFEARELLEQGAASDLPGVAAVLRGLTARVDRSITNHAGIQRINAELERCSSPQQRAVLILDLYRRMVEGQFRPWAWVLLQVTGARQGEAPELSTLRDQLMASSSPLLRASASAVLPAARNASAHEDYAWDDEAEALLVGDEMITADELEDAVERAYAFMAGAECALACLRFSSKSLAAHLDVGPAGRSRGLDLRRASGFFGTNGLRVRDSAFDKRRLKFTLDSLPLQRVNPCFQAAMWASRAVPHADTVVVEVEGHDLPAMELPRGALEATYLVWREARARFSQMPLSTFLPANAAARLAVESPGDAATSVAWLAVNDAVHGYLDAYEWRERGASVPQVVSLLGARLDIVAAATAVSAAVLPTSSIAALDRVLELVVPAVEWTFRALHGEMGPSEQLERSIRDLLDSLPIASVLPTLDPRPLSELEDDEATT